MNGGSSTGGNAGGGQGGGSNKAGSSNQGGKAPGAGGNSAGGGSAGGSSTGGSSEAGAPSAGAGGAADDVGAVVSECLDAPIINEPTEALLFTAAGLKLGIVRRTDPDSIGTSGTWPWLAQRFAFERGAAAECVTDTARLDYVGSHHNFDDQITASVGSETWIFRQARESYASPTTWSVEVRSGNELSWGPVALTLVSCKDASRPNGSCASYYLDLAGDQ